MKYLLVANFFFWIYWHSLSQGMAGSTQVISPIAGLFSDRMTSRFGRRRPFIVIGMIVALLSLAVSACWWYYQICGE